MSEIKRFDWDCCRSGCEFNPCEEPDGEWVRGVDHDAKVTEIAQEIERLGSMVSKGLDNAYQQRQEIERLNAELEQVKKAQGVPVAVLCPDGTVLTKLDCASESTFEICCKVQTPLYTAPPSIPETDTFQARVKPWLSACFGDEIAGDTVERNHRFLEESLELVQACECTADEAHKLVDYVFGRPIGERSQEVGGVMVTLAALCLAQGLDMHESGETELSRINKPEMVERIREKQKRKPAMSPLPGSYPDRKPIPEISVVVERELLKHCIAELEDWAMSFPDAESMKTYEVSAALRAILSGKGGDQNE